MSKKMKIWLIIAAFLVLIGCLLFGGVMRGLQWDFTKLSTSKYETSNYEINEAYSNICVITDTADIVFAVSEDSKCTVDCYEQENVKHSVTVKDDTLVIQVVDTRKWYEHIGINFGTPKITVHLPQGEYGGLSLKSDTGDVEIPDAFRFESMDISESTGNVTNYASASGTVQIKTSTGDIHVENVSADTLVLEASTGRITASKIRCDGAAQICVTTGKTTLTDFVCKSLTSQGDTGRIAMTDLRVKENLSVERSTGDVRFDRCDAGEIFVKTDTGDVTGTLLTGKLFVTHTDTGRVEVPQAITGGKCQITTDTGDIVLSIEN